MDDASAFVEELIDNLAEDFVAFHIKHSKQWTI
jgi:hypothetical protein